MCHLVHSEKAIFQHNLPMPNLPSINWYLSPYNELL
jgi:hypothetical protein